jgi:hypothetical protein
LYLVKQILCEILPNKSYRALYPILCNDFVCDELTPQSRTLLGKLLVTHLLKKYPHLSWNCKVHYRVENSLPLDLNFI